MKTHKQKPESVSHTIQGKNRSAKQADIQSVLQKYDVIQRQEKLSDDEKNIVKLYMGNNFEQPNQVLRDDGKGKEKLDDYDKHVYENLEGIINKVTLSENMTLYRGSSKENFGKQARDTIAVGEVIKDKAFLSTSKNRSVAETYHDGLFLNINAPAGTPAIDTEAHNIPPVFEGLDSREVILQKGLEMKVDNSKECQIKGKPAQEVDVSIMTSEEVDINTVKDCGCCYITTACVNYMGLPDDCEELTVLRYFRDTYLMNKENGKELINRYYVQSPVILNNIRNRYREEEERILLGLYSVIKDCVNAIKQGNNEYAFETYCDMVIKLNQKYGCITQ